MIVFVGLFEVLIEVLDIKFFIVMGLVCWVYLVGIVFEFGGCGYMLGFVGVIFEV